MTVAAQALSVSDRQELDELVVEHAWLLDHGRWHEVADLYVDGGTLSIGGRVLTGRAEFLAWADLRAANSGRRTHHQCTNLRLRSEGDGTASGTVMLVLHVSEGGPAFVEFVGEYRDRYEQGHDSKWRFGSRELHPLADIEAKDGNTDSGDTNA